MHNFKETPHIKTYRDTVREITIYEFDGTERYVLPSWMVDRRMDLDPESSDDEDSIGSFHSEDYDPVDAAMIRTVHRHATPDMLAILGYRGLHVNRNGHLDRDDHFPELDDVSPYYGSETVDNFRNGVWPVPNTNVEIESPFPNLRSLAHFINGTSVPRFNPTLEIDDWTFSLNFFEPIYSVSDIELLDDTSEFELQALEIITQSVDKDWVLKLIEDVGLFVSFLLKSDSVSDYSAAVIMFVKLRINGPLVSADMYNRLQSYFDEVFAWNVQGIEENLVFARMSLDKFDEMKDSMIFKKIYKVCMYMLSLNLCEKVGITFDKFNYSRVESEAIKRKYHQGLDFYRTMIDTTLFLFERGYQCFVTGSLEPIFHSSKAYTDFYMKFLTLKRQAELLNEPELFGFTEHSFLKDLDDHIEKGDSIIKYKNSMKEFDRLSMSKYIDQLKSIRDEQFTRRRAMEMRRPPLALLVYGDSSVGKTTFMDILFIYHAKKEGLSFEDSCRFTKNPYADFWTGFKTSCHTVQIDEIAPLKPGATPDIDPSVKEVLQVINQQPYLPAQASLEDKGKTPVRPRLVLASTNNRSLGAWHSFFAPSATQRRFPYIVDIRPKCEYTDDSGMLKSSSVPLSMEGSFPDLWIIDVYKVSPTSVRVPIPAQAIEELVLEGADMKEFLKFYAKIIDEHNYVQDIVSVSCKKMRSVELCLLCFQPHEYCDCKLQSISEHILFPVALSIWILNRLFDMYCRFRFVRNLWYLFNYSTSLRSYMGVIQFTFFPHIDFCGLFERRMFSRIGQEIQDKIGYPKFLAACTAILVTGLSFYTFTSLLSHKETKKLEVQAVHKDKGRAPVGEDETINVWYKDHYQLTDFDLTRKSLSWKGLSIDNLHNRLLRNCIHLHYNINGRVNDIRAVGLKGNIYLLNSHFIPPDEFFDLRIVRGGEQAGVSTQRTVRMYRSQFMFEENSDLCFVEFKDLPPVADITQLFCRNSLGGSFHGSSLSRGSNGENEILSINKCFSQAVYCNQFGYNIDVWNYERPIDATNGICGSLIVGLTSFGPVLLGIHTLGNGKVCMALRVSIEIIERRITCFGYQVQAGAPKINASGTNFTLVSLHEKSPIRYVESGAANVYGSFLGYRASPTSRVERTLLCDLLLGSGYELKYGAPSMHHWKPKRKALLDMVNPPIGLNLPLFQKCAKFFLKDILSKISREDLKEVHIYDDFTAVNGAAGVKFIDKINRNSSMGFPWKKTKKYFFKFIEPVGDNQHPIEMDEEVIERVYEMIEQYEAGKRCCVIYSAALKDEARKFSKIESHATRLFTCAPVDASILGRKYMLALVRVMQRNRFIFEAAPGLVCQSMEWQDLYDYLTSFGSDRIVAGDFANFDKTATSAALQTVFWVLIEICRASGNYDEKDMRVLHGIAIDTCFPWVDFFGDLIEFFTINPSGHFLTVIVNSVLNSLYMRYCFAILSPDCSCADFKKYVHLMTYGDDNIMGVSSETPWYNHSTIKEIFSTIGIVYTMAEKEAISVPYINIYDATFLKRSWRRDENVGTHLAPLELESIHKMLTVWVRSKTITAGEQMESIVSSAVREYFYYGKSVFQKESEFLLSLMIKANLETYVCESTFPTWDNLIEEFFISSELLGCLSYHPSLKEKNQLVTNCDSYCLQATASYSKLERMDHNYPSAPAIPKASIKKSAADARQKSYFAKKLSSNLASYEGLTNYENPLKQREVSRLHIPEEVCQEDYFLRILRKECLYLNYNSRCSLLSYIYALQEQQSRETPVGDKRCSEIYSVGKSHPVFTSEYTLNAGETGGHDTTQGDHGSAVGQQEQVNVEFVDENPGTHTEFPEILDPTFNDNYIPASDIIKFLSRPYRIQNYVWTEGSSLAQNFQPWDLFFNATSIKKKLDNFAFIHCNLHVKILINASPFYYGAVIASYVPLTTFNTTYLSANASSASAALTAGGDSNLCQLSQCPHVMLYPQTCQGGELTLPFFYHQDWLPVVTRSEFQQMGVIYLQSFTPLQNASSSAGSGVTVSVYAWATDVKLSGPTTGLALQADEWNLNGPVSKPASALASVASSLTNVPVIGRFAKATSMIASAVGSAASIFGFTNVPVIEDVCPYKPTSFHSFASTEISQPIEKLTIDPKNELSIDPRIVGLDGTDSMITQNFVKREAYICQPVWSGTNVTDDILFNCYVSPYHQNLETHSTFKYVTGTPLSHISCMFGYWRGSIVYRFRFIASRFHRGRVIIQWDPKANVGAVANVSNQAYTKIVDISEETDVEIEIPYLQQTAYQQTALYNSNANQQAVYHAINGTVAAAYIDGVFNGYLSVKCLTAQTSPVTAANIEILVSVRGGDDFEFANPIDLQQDTSFYSLNSQELIQYDEPQQLLSGKKESHLPSEIKNVVFMGEKIVSLRQILRRTTLQRVYNNITFSTSNKWSAYILNHAYNPLYFGFDANGINTAKGLITTATTFPFNFVLVTPYSWLSPCFRSYRGSQIWHYALSSPALVNDNLLTASRNIGSLTAANYYQALTVLLAGYSNSIGANYFLNTFSSGAGGQSCVLTKTQGGISALYPMYSKFRMRTTDISTATLGTGNDDTNKEYASFRYQLQTQASNSSDQFMTNLYHSIGTDFSFLFFLHVPTYVIIASIIPV